MAAHYEKPDSWSIKAKKEGYPARSVYKLEEIDAKFSLFGRARRILDIGAAPGSWTLWTLRRLKGAGFLAAVDLQPLSIAQPAGGFLFVQGDIMEEAVYAELAAAGPYDLVISDAAPSTTGNRMVDTARSAALVEEVILYADRLLAAGGNFCCKIFQGGDEKALLGMLKERYETARGFKPQVCRAESFETYLVGLRKKRGPEKD